MTITLYYYIEHINFLVRYGMYHPVHPHSLDIGLRT